MGTAFRMGSGYFPAMLASFLIVIGLIVACLAFRSGEVKLPKVAWRPLIMVSAAVALFGLILNGAGLLLATFAMVVLSRLARPGYPWIETVVLGVALSVLFAAIFYFGLRIQMPLLPTWWS
jgi:putative tricarboxylic transport membrane protein